MLGVGQMALRLPCDHDSLALSCHLCCRYFPSTLCIQKKMGGHTQVFYLCTSVGGTYQESSILTSVIASIGL